jgi:protein-tyrosine phosphatase
MKLPMNLDFITKPDTMSNNNSSSEIQFKNLLNFRDIGGIVADNDKRVRNGIIFRSANPDNLSREDIEKLHFLKIKTIIDLRAPGEWKKNRRTIENVDILSLPLDFQKTTREKLNHFYEGRTQKL